MPTLVELMDEVKSLSHAITTRVDELDKGQKKLGEELTSKTAAMPAEYKESFEKLNTRVNDLTDIIEKARIEAMRPKLADESKNGKKERSAAHQAFMKAMRHHGKLDEHTQEEKSLISYNYMPQEQKALYVGDATTGGFFASTDFIAELLEYRTLISKVRGIARVISTSGEKVQMPALASDTTAAWSTEQASFSDSTDPTTSMVNIPVHELRGLLKISQQNLEDSMFPLEDLIKERLMLQFAKVEGKAFVRGSGSGQPRGIMAYPTKATTGYTGGSAGKNNVTDAIPYVLSGAASGKINADDVLNVKMDLKADYDANATYIFTRGTLNTVRLLKDSQNRPLWQPFAGNNLPSLIYDAPYVEMPDCDEISSGNYPIIVGDFKQYMIVDRITMNMRQLNELGALQGLIYFVARMRLGGDVLVPEAFRTLKIN